MAFVAEVVLKNDSMENVHLSVNELSYVEIHKDGAVSSFDTLNLEKLALEAAATYRFVGRDDVLLVSGSALLAINFKKR